MPPTTIGGGGIGFGDAFRLSVRPFTPVSRAAISLYLLNGFQWNLAQIFIMWVGIAENVLKVKGHRSEVKVMTGPNSRRSVIKQILFINYDYAQWVSFRSPVSVVWLCKLVSGWGVYGATLWGHVTRRLYFFNTCVTGGVRTAEQVWDRGDEGGDGHGWYNEIQVQEHHRTVGEYTARTCEMSSTC